MKAKKELSMEELEEQIAKVTDDLKNLRKQRAAEAAEAHEVIQKVVFNLGKLRNKWMNRKKRVKLSEYAEAMAKQSQMLVPRMVVTQQAHLCRSLHWMDMHNAQLKLIQEHKDSLVMFMKAQIAAMHEEYSEVERIGMNKILKMDMDIRMTKEDYGLQGGSSTPIWQGSLGKPFCKIQGEPSAVKLSKKKKKKTKTKETTTSWSSQNSGPRVRSVSPRIRLTHSLRGIFNRPKRTLSPNPRKQKSVVETRVYSRRESCDGVISAR